MSNHIKAMATQPALSLPRASELVKAGFRDHAEPQCSWRCCCGLVKSFWLRLQEVVTLNHMFNLISNATNRNAHSITVISNSEILRHILKTQKLQNMIIPWVSRSSWPVLVSLLPKLRACFEKYARAQLCS